MDQGPNMVSSVRDVRKHAEKLKVWIWVIYVEKEAGFTEKEAEIAESLPRKSSHFGHYYEYRPFGLKLSHCREKQVGTDHYFLRELFDLEKLTGQVWNRFYK